VKLDDDGLNTFNPPRKYRRAFTVVLMLVLIVSACTSSRPLAANGLTPQPLQVTQVVTLLVTRDITLEVTRVIEVPVTVTPPPASLVTSTPALPPDTTAAPAITPASELPVVALQEYSDCLYGPASFYLYKTSFPARALMEVVGRDLDGAWLELQELHGWNPCWIPAARVKFTTGGIQTLPVVYPLLPLSTQYASPDAVARRTGSEVTVSWKAVWMSFDDYRGYLIEAWVCQGGTQVFLPLSYVPALESNTGNLSVKITDEIGCDLPSSARIYSADKYGYSAWQSIFWPPN
jgi:hypothetical protein